MGNPPPVFEPAKIERIDLERPVTRNQRALPDSEVKRIRGERIKLERTWSIRDERMQRRLKLYPIGAVVGMSIAFGFILPVGFSILQLILYALFGVYLAFMRPMRMHATLATLALAAAVYFTANTRGALTQFNIFYIVLGLIGIGAMIGTAEESKLG